MSKANGDSPVMEMASEWSVKSSPIKSSPLELPPCLVCGGRASGIHYGVNSCEACKGFFRRFLSRKDPYVCGKENTCEITDRPRGNCSACRMEKCLKLGMSKDAVRQGRYTLEERTKTINTVRMLQGKDTDDMETFERKPDISSLPSSYPSFHQIDESSRDTLMSDDIKPAMEIQSLSIQSNSVSSSYATTPSDNLNSSNSSPQSDNSDGDSKFQVIMTSLCNAYDNFSYPSRRYTEEDLQKKFQEASVLCAFSNDQICVKSLVSERHQATKALMGSLKPLKPEEFKEVFEATGLDVDGRQAWMLKNKEVWEEIVTQYVHFAKAIPGFTELSIADQSTLLKVARFEFFMIIEHNCINPELEVLVVHTGESLHLEEMCYYSPKEIMKNWLDFSKRIKEFNFFKEELVLVLAICLTFRDRKKLENPDQVEELQLKLIACLRHVLRCRYGNKEFVVFTKIMDLFVAFRQLTNEFLSAFKHMCDDNMVKQTLPEMLEFLFDDDT